MRQQKKTVLIIEDEEPQREVLIKTLKHYGFEAEGGETIAQTFELLETYKNDAAVIILDMEMGKFPDYQKQSETLGSPVTGIGLAKEVLGRKSDWNPQIVILSAWINRIDYFRQAIQAGASDYLQKGVEGKEKLIPLIQALTLKYVFQPNSSNDREIKNLVKGHANAFELLNYFCINKLIPELSLCLTESSFILLFRHRNISEEESLKQENFVSMHSVIADVPDRENFDYSRLHKRIFNQDLRRSVYIPEDRDFRGEELGKLKECTFVQLVNSSEVEIAIGILDPFPIEDKLDKYSVLAKVLAEAFVEHTSPFLETFVEKLMFHWRESQGLKLERVKTLANFGSSIQRELNIGLFDKNPETIEQSIEHFGALKKFSRGLSDYNEHLFSLLEKNQTPSPRLNISTTRLSEIVQEFKIEYARKGHFNDVLFSLENDCLITTERDYLSLALDELIKWAVERKDEVTDGEKQTIQIDCVSRDNWVEIYFRENSRQLSKPIRENYLFEPITHMHIARTIVEIALHGELIDTTGESGNEVGHTFKIKLLSY